LLTCAKTSRLDARPGSRALQAVLEAEASKIGLYNRGRHILVAKTCKFVSSILPGPLDTSCMHLRCSCVSRSRVAFRVSSKSLHLKILALSEGKFRQIMKEALPPDSSLFVIITPQSILFRQFTSNVEISPYTRSPEHLEGYRVDYHGMNLKSITE